MGERPSGPTGWLRGLFAGKDDAGQEPELPGQPTRTTGAGALLATEALAAEAICRPSGGEPLPAEGEPLPAEDEPLPAEDEPLPAEDRNAFDQTLTVAESTTPAAALATANGLAMAGLRTAVFAAGEGLGTAVGELRTAARRRLPLVVHGALDVGVRGHGSYHALADAGAFLTLARNPQEAVDLTLVAHLVAEQTLVPGVVAGDGGEEEEEILLPSAELVRRYLGDPAAEVGSPTPAQTLLFGPQRRRVPRWLDPDRAGAFGLPPQGPDLTAALAGEEVFFGAPLRQLAADAMAALTQVTGRPLGFVHGEGIDGARYVLVAQGAAAEAAIRAAGALREQKVGVLALTWLRPFPAAEVREALAGVEAVTVVEASGDVLGDPPLLRDLRASLAGEKAPRLLSALYRGPVHGDQLVALGRNMAQGDAARSTVWLGVASPRTGTASGYPRQEALVQRVRREYPEIESLTLPVEAAAGEKPAPAGPEPELPMAVRRFGHGGTTWDNVARFWGEHVQPRLGEAGEATPDPYLTLGAMPACTATFHDRTPGREELPRIDPEACTGCGLCWTACPDSALAAVALGTEALLNAAADRVAARAKTEPHPVVAKLRRAHRQLASRIDGELAKAEARRVTAKLVREAGNWLAGKMKLEADDERPFKLAIQELAAEIGSLPLAATEALFHQPHKETKGSGALLMPAVNPQACQGCGICKEVCAEEAVAVEPQTPELVAEARTLWRAWEELPDTPGETISRAAEHDDVGALPAILMSRHILFSAAGGDPAEPGSGQRLAVRQVAAVAEYHMQHRLLVHGRALDQLGERLREAVRGAMTAAVPVADLDALDEALAEAPQHPGNLPAVLAKMEELDKHPGVDAPAVRQLIRSSRDVERLRWEVAEGAHGTGRARFALVVAGPEVAQWAARFPRNPFSVPVAAALDGTGADLALGAVRGLLAERVAAARLIRRAELRLEAPSDLPVKEKELADLGREGLTPEELALAPPVLVVGERQSLTDSGLDGLSRLLSSGLPVKVLLLDEGDLTRTEADPVLLALAHRRAFVVATSVAHPEHLFDGVTAALDFPGPALFCVHAPSPSRHGFAPAATFERAWAAVDCRVQPLVRYDPRGDGVFGTRLSLAGNPLPKQPWTQDDDGVDQTPAVWAGGEERFAGDEVAAAVEERGEHWRTLQELAGAVTPFTALVRSELEEELREAHTSELEALRREYEGKLATSEATQRAAIAAQLRDRLVQLAEHGRARRQEGEVA